MLSSISRKVSQFVSITKIPNLSKHFAKTVISARVYNWIKYRKIYIIYVFWTKSLIHLNIPDTTEKCG